ncbi:low temperature requirement protein A [Bacillaceae bacterium C204]|jgi:low temperature requirement protein LtrA|uniref:low temperature requirement protein A n=1 Tax=Neobacillus sp. 204 TaxID=3383351 RepID=UPI0039787E6C
MVEKKVTWLELFCDLLYVAAISKATHVLLRVNEGEVLFVNLLKFNLIFIPVWWAWVGQTMFVNRFGKDKFHQRFLIIFQMVFVLILISSLSVDFDRYYIPFLVGFIGVRVLTAFQYFLVIRKGKREQNKAAYYLATRFWIGIFISSCSIFCSSWFKYVVLYIGIIVDIFIPLFGRKHLVKHPVNTSHLLERFGLLTLILLGESIISILSVLHPQIGRWNAIGYSVLSFSLIISFWWQYFDNLEKKIDKAIKTTGQMILYGHLFIYISLSMIAASIQLLFNEEISYYFILNFIFGAALIYFLSTTLVFHKYRYEDQKLKIFHLSLFLSIILSFYIFDIFIPVSGIIILLQINVFFVIYAKVST